MLTEFGYRAMSCSRAEVLSALRAYGRPVWPMDLAVMMGRSPQRVAAVLRVLYFMDKIDRTKHPTKKRYMYRPKELNA